MIDATGMALRVALRCLMEGLRPGHTGPSGAGDRDDVNLAGTWATGLAAV